MIEQKTHTGVSIGLLVGLDANKNPLIAFADNPTETALAARTTVSIGVQDAGREVAVMFEHGDVAQPLIIGFIQHPSRVEYNNTPSLHRAEIDDDEIVLSAKKRVTIKCGTSSITLTESGKIIIRGKYLSSRSSGVNRIKGGSVQIN